MATIKDIGTRYAQLAWLGSMLAIIAVIYFQYVEGLEPCVLCLYQRIPHYVVLVLGFFALHHLPILRPILGFVMLIGAGIAGFHVGVEFGWWEGLKTCSANTTALTAEALLATPPAQCDEVTWRFLGQSMASWNMLLSLVLALTWFQSFVKVS